MPTPSTLVWDDDFTNAPVSGSRAASYPTATGGAGSTTGVLNGWTDRAGGKWNLSSSGVCHSAGTDYAATQLYRPSGENHTDARIVWTRPNNATIFGGWLRLTPSAGTGYLAYTDGSRLWLANEANTSIAGVSYVPGTRQFITVDFQVVGNVLTASVSYSGTGSGDDGGKTVTYTDTTNRYTAAGAYGFSTNAAGDVYHAQTYHGDTPAPATTYTLSPSPAAVNTGQTTTVTLAPNGTSAATVTVTPTGTAAGGLSAQAATFDGTSAAKTVTFTPTNAGTLTLTGTNSGSLTNPAAGTVTVNGVALSAGTAKAVSSASNVRLYLDGTNGSAAPNGGLGPYSYQWHRSLSPNFTPGGSGGSGTSLSGATSATLTDVPPDQQLYTYRCVVTDSTGTPQTATTADAPGELLGAALAVGFVGDSLYINIPGGDTLTPVGYFAALAPYFGGRLQAVTAVNAAVSGSMSSNWVSGSANMTAALASFASAGVQWVFVRLGANDSSSSVSAATYLSNMTSAVGALTGAGYKVILNYALYGTGTWAGAKNAFVTQYNAQLAALVNGTTVYQGDKKLYDAWAVQANPLVEGPGAGIHPTTAGARVMAETDVRTLSNILYPAAGGGSTTYIFGSEG